MTVLSDFALKKNLLWRILIPITSWLVKRVTKIEVINQSVLNSKGGLVIASNHISWFDSFPLALTIINQGRLPRFLATEEIFSYPVFGHIVNKLGFIRVRKNVEANGLTLAKAIDSCAAGDTLVFYPEARVTNCDEYKVLKIKPGAIQTALKTHQPLIPVAIWGPQLIAPKPKSFKPFPKKQTIIKFGDPFDLSDYWFKNLSKAELNQLCEELRAELQQLLNSIKY